MSTPKLVQSNFSDLFGSSSLPVLEFLFRSNLERHPSVRDQVFESISSDREIFQYSEVHDMPLMSSISEGTDYAFERPKQGYDKTLTAVKYGLGFSISEEAIEDGKFNFVADALSKLAMSAKETQEQNAMNMLNNGFSSETTADGLALFHTAHTTPSGSITFANKPSTDADLSFTALSDAISAFKKNFRGDSGIYYHLMPKKLVVPVELELYARQLVSSIQQADSADNNMNPFYNQLQVIPSPHLTDADAWFLCADKKDVGVKIISRKGIESKAGGADAGFLNDSVLFKVRYRESMGALNAYGIYGTSGA